MRSNALLEQFLCPLLHDIMIEPASTVDGHTFEKSAIEIWLEKRCQWVLVGVLHPPPPPLYLLDPRECVPVFRACNCSCAATCASSTTSTPDLTVPGALHGSVPSSHGSFHTLCVCVSSCPLLLHHHSGRVVSPVTGEPLVSLALVPNKALSAKINTFGLGLRAAGSGSPGRPGGGADRSSSGRWVQPPYIQRARGLGPRWRTRPSCPSACALCVPV